MYKGEKMKKIIIIILLSIVLNQERINAREYKPIDKFIAEPYVYVYSINDTIDSYVQYTSIPIGQDTLLIEESYDENLDFPRYKIVHSRYQNEIEKKMKYLERK